MRARHLVLAKALVNADRLGASLAVAMSRGYCASSPAAAASASSGVELQQQTAVAGNWLLGSLACLRLPVDGKTKAAPAALAASRASSFLASLGVLNVASCEAPAAAAAAPAASVTGTVTVVSAPVPPASSAPAVLDAANPIPTGTPVADLSPADLAVLRAYPHPAVDMSQYDPPSSYTAKLMDGLVALHDMVGLPWWGTIVVGCLMMRVLTLPFMRISAVNGAGMAAAQPEMQFHQARLQAASSPEEKQQISFHIMGVMAKYKASPVKMFVGVMATFPIFISMFLCLRALAANPYLYGELSQGGVWIWTNLAERDPTYLFPIISGLSGLGILEFNFAQQKAAAAAGGGPQRNEKVMGMVQNAFRVITVITIPLIAQFPVALFFYWIPNNVITFLWSVATRSGACCCPACSGEGSACSCVLVRICSCAFSILNPPPPSLSLSLPSLALSAEVGKKLLGFPTFPVYTGPRADPPTGGLASLLSSAQPGGATSSGPAGPPKMFKGPMPARFRKGAGDADGARA